MLTITVEQPSGVSLSQTVGAVRSWLDSEGIEPLSFRPIALSPRGGIGFEIQFQTEDDADRFGQEFA